MENVLSVQQLTKYYGRLCALNQINFQIPKGSIFGILGPNGSGKTTFLGIIMDVLKASSGTFTWHHGTGPSADRKQIGTLLETPNFYPYLSARDNLRINARLKECPVADIDRVLKIVQLYERRHSVFKTYSLGMKQRLAIGAALLGDPKIVVLDEPTNGLDPVGIADIRNLVIRMGQAGKTIIMASHLLDEVEKVCSHVSILQQGNIRACGPVGEVLSSEDMVVVSADNLALLETILTECEGVKKINRCKGYLQVGLKNNFSAAQLNMFCFEKNMVLSQLQKQPKSLELKFLELTNGSKQ